MKALTRSTFIVLLVSIGSLPRSALAQSANTQAAEGLFQEGLSLLESGKTSEACEKFVASHRLDPANGTLQNVASCHEKEGRTASAWSEWLDLAGRAARAGQAEREALARTRAAALSKELSRVELRFPASSNVALIEIDGQPLSQSAWTTPLPLDPGSRTLVFKAPGKKDATSRVVIAAQATLTVDVPVLETDPKAVSPTSPKPAAEPSKIETTGSSGRTLGFIAGGVGIAAVGVGAFFGLRAMSLKDDAGCNGEKCANQAAVDDRDAAKSSATISTIGFGVGIVGLAVGTYLVLTSKSTPTSAQGLSPLLGAGPTGISYRW